MKGRQGRYAVSVPRVCKWCNAPFQTDAPKAAYCGDACRVSSGLPPSRRRGNTSHFSLDRKKMLAMVTTCPACGKEGPRARLTEHCLVDHGGLA